MACVLWLFSCSSPSNFDPDRSVYPAKGIDVSAHNGLIDYQKAAADSIEFVFIKATEGADFCDVFFDRNYEGARAAGLKVGAYHFFRFDMPGHMQAYHFLSTLRGRTLDFPLAIDVEEWHNAENVPDQEVAGQLGNMLQVLTEAGFATIIYTNRRGYERYVAPYFDDIPVWICSLSSEPADIPNWQVWQHSHQGKVDGIKGPVDLNTLRPRAGNH